MGDSAIRHKPSDQFAFGDKKRCHFFDGLLTGISRDISLICHTQSFILPLACACSTPSLSLMARWQAAGVAWPLRNERVVVLMVPALGNRRKQACQQFLLTLRNYLT